METYKNVQLTPIQEFYRNASVLITGGTGFCGQVLIEKMLRSCPEIRHIYLLMRDKNGKTAIERQRTLLQEPIFESLKSRDENIFKKIIGISGDISQSGLGLSVENSELLAKEVSVVFHVAATIKFNENFKVALETNVKGAQEIIDFCYAMKKLKALVYVSTAYSQCHLEEIEERVYPPPIDPKILYECASRMTGEEFELIENLLLNKWPNTYSYSKALAEHVMYTQRDNLPIAIIRPSIVISTWRDPMPGWINNTNGPTLGIIGTSMGMIRCGHVDKRKISDIVPVDMVVNALIATAWETSLSRKGLKVYNLVSSVQCPITWGQYFSLCKEHILHQPSSLSVWYYCLVLSRHKHMYRILSFWLEFLPACFIDILPFIFTGKHKNIDMYLKSCKFQHLVSFFATRDWKFQDGNIRALLNKMSPHDQAIFYFDMNLLDWNEYLLHYIAGIRQYLLKESPDTIPAARKRYNVLYLIHCLLQFGVSYAAYKILLSRILSKIINMLLRL